MNTDLSQAVIADVTAFARDHVASRPDLHQMKDFPPDLWQALAAHGLTGLGIPEEYGGRGCDYGMLAKAATALAETGGNQGVVMTWMAHNMNAALHLGSAGTDEQRKTWLPRIAAGDSSLTVAISEPGAGAHPKRLATKAVRDGDDYVLNGEKSYLTNGPLADVFLVLAITDETDGRKSFSAFLVPRATPGLEQTAGIEIDFLHPSPHCGLKLQDCRVPASNMVGAEGTAFERISLTMRAVEDALSTAATVGALRYLLNQLAASASDLPRDAIMQLGDMAGHIDMLQRISQDIAAELDHMAPDFAGQSQQLMLLIAGFRSCMNALPEDIADLAGEFNLSPGLAWQAAHRDIIKMSGIAATVWQARALKRGQALLAEMTANT
jgi:alkylation response protein AidB-like acyl-CoA dehydrogenase